MLHTEISAEVAKEILLALADVITVDIASVEAGHSSLREFANLRSRGWVTSLETISARFVIQRLGSGKSESDSGKRKKQRVRKRKKVAEAPGEFS